MACSSSTGPMKVQDDVSIMDAGDQRPPAANTSVTEKLNASQMRIVNSAKRRALNTQKQRTLKANNTALARSLSLAKEEVKLLRAKVISLQFKNQDLELKLASANDNALFDEAVREEVKTRVFGIMGQVEEEFGDVKNHILRYTEKIDKLKNEFGEASDMMDQCMGPMSRLNTLIKKYTDELGDFMDDSDDAGDGAANRKTLAAMRRQTRAALNVNDAEEPQQRPLQDAGVGQKRKTTGKVNFRVVESDSDDVEDQADIRNRALARKTIAKVAFGNMGRDADDEPENAFFSDKTEPVRRRTAFPVLRTIDVPINETSQAKEPKMVGDTASPDGADRPKTPDLDESDLPANGTIAELVRRRTIAKLNIQKNEQMSDGEEIEPAKKGRVDAARRKTTISLQTRAIATVVDEPGQDASTVTPTGKKDVAKKSTRSKAKRGTAAVSDSKETKMDDDGVENAAAPKEKIKTTTAASKNVKRRAKSVSQKEAESKEAAAVWDAGSSGTANTQRKTRRVDKSKKVEDHESDEQEEDRKMRLRRHTAVSYKEAPLNNKMRR